MNLLHGHFNLAFWATYGISLEFKSQPSPVGKRLSFFKFVSFYFFLDSKVILLLRSFCQQPLPKTDIPSNVFSFVVILMPFFFALSVPALSLSSYLKSVPSLSSRHDYMSFITDEMEAVKGKLSFSLSLCREKPSSSLLGVSSLCVSFTSTENTSLLTLPITKCVEVYPYTK